jgi:hypothetical protein
MHVHRVNNFRQKPQTKHMAKTRWILQNESQLGLFEITDQRIQYEAHYIGTKFKFSNCRLGGVMISMLGIGTKVCGFKPGRGDKLLKAIKIRSIPSFGGEVNTETPRRKILWYVKISCKYKQKYFARLNYYSLRPFLLLATRYLHR